MADSARRKPTIHDVAAASGVSSTTVSAALTGNGRVGEDTRRLVAEAAERLGYRPNAVARALRTATHSAVGVVLPDVAALRSGQSNAYSEYYMRLVYAVTSAAAPPGSATLLLTRVESEAQLAALAVDGLIVCDPSGDADAALDIIDACRRLGLPAVTNELDPRHPAHRASVTSGDAANVVEMLDHLWERGARTVMLVLPGSDAAEHPESDENPVITAYLAWCRARGTAPRVSSASVGVPDDAGILVSADDPPDAILDFAAPAALRSATRAGLRVPHDLLIASYVDGPSAWSTEPPLTAFELHPDEIGRVSTEMLFSLIGGEPVEPLVVGADLVARASTAAAS